MKSYFRIMLGAKSKFAKECYEGNFIGADFDIDENLSGKLPDRWQDFNKIYRQVWMEKNPGKSKVSAGLACGFLWTICKGLQEGDVVLCPDGEGAYWVGEITSGYSFHPNENLPHRRELNWFTAKIQREEMSVELQRSTGSIGTVSRISKHSDELEKLIEGERGPSIISTDETVEDASVFALEKHLEDFLVENWASTELGSRYDIFQEDGEIVGQQYPSDTGPIDILAISKDKSELLVVELKKGRVSDTVVGQIQRYMGYVKEELAESNQTVKGIIIGLEDDQKIKRALQVAVGIDFYRYQVSFKLLKGLGGD